jgi:hypothetical protein
VVRQVGRVTRTKIHRGKIAMMNRREFTGCLIGTAVLAYAGPNSCNTPSLQNVLDELNAWVPVAIVTFDGIVAFVDSVLTAVAVAVDAAWRLLQGAITAYMHTTDPTTTAFDKVIAALDAVETQMAGIVAQLPPGIPANILAAARGGFALLIATLKDIQQHLNPTPTTVQAGIRANSARAIASLPATKPAKNAKDFANQINAIMVANGQTFRVK